ncbi:MAG: polymer-forming cytoskeletal protein [Parcubacteria group bacterium]|nr:polymer-forming cytoskeletal protein [Parcubacteria group bacterium]
MKAGFFLPLAVLILFAGTPQTLAKEADPASAPWQAKDYFSFVAEVRVPEEGARDVVAAGGVVDINNPVAQDVLALGGTVIIQSQVSGDVRLAGKRVVIASDISGNAAVLAQTVEIRPGSTIAGSMEIRAKDVVIEGTILGDAHIAAETLLQNGTIGGELTHDPIGTPGYERSPIAWFFRIISLFGMLVTGLVLVSVTPLLVRYMVRESIKNPGRDILWGVAALALVPIAALVLSLTVIGFPLGVILGTSLFVALYIAKILVGIALGTYLIGAFRGREEAQKASLLWTMVLGIAVLWLVIGIPSIGWLLKLVALVWGLGMLVRLGFRLFKALES